jgi:diaminobutyrate-2-oxoglutarate transaminase
VSGATAAETGTESARIVNRIKAREGGGLRTFMGKPAETVVWDSAQGATVVDADGREYTDLYAGFAVGNVGYSHPKVVAAIQRQAGTLMHCPSFAPSRTRADFYDALASIAMPELTRMVPAITGAMANEIALSYVRITRGDGPIVAFRGGYFGRSLGIVGIAGKERYREALRIPPAAEFFDFPYPFRSGDADGGVGATMEALEAWTASSSQPPAAVFTEPVQGNGGVLIPPDDFLPRLREYCDRTGAALVVDEIQSGCGRSGKMWASEYSGVTPDLMTAGKGIGGGLAVAAVLGGEDFAEVPPDTFTSTFLTNALNLAAATAAMEVIRDESLDERSRVLGERALERLRHDLEALPQVGEVRGRGLWIGIEIVDGSGAIDAAAAQRIQGAARSAGLIVGRGGHEENVVKLSPPLVIEEDLLDRSLATLVECVAAETGAVS